MGGIGRLHHDFGLGYASSNYHPSLGYYYDQGTFRSGFSFGKDYRDEGSGPKFRSWSVGAEYFPYLHEDGIYHSRLGGDYSMTWRDGRSLDFGFDHGLDDNHGITDVYVSFGWNRNELHRAGGPGAVRGSRAGGDYTAVPLDQGLRPLEKVSLRARVE